MDETIYLEPNNNISDISDVSDIVDIMTTHFDKINKLAGFNVNKRIHPSYSKQTTTLIPSLKPISLSSKDQKLFPQKLNKNIMIPSEPIKSDIILLLPGSSRKNIMLPESPRKDIILPLPGSPKSSIPLPKSVTPPRSPKSIILPRSSKSIILPESPRIIIPFPKGDIILPKNNIILPKTNHLPVEEVSPLLSKLKTITVTDLRPNIPKIDNFNTLGNYKNSQTQYKDLGTQGIPNKIELPKLTTVLNSEKSRPVIVNTQNSNIPETPDMDDEHRKILLNIDSSKLSKNRRGKNNETYDLPFTKELARSIGVSPKGNKD